MNFNHDFKATLQFLAHHLILFQPGEGADSARPLLRAPLIFLTFRHMLSFNLNPVFA